MVNNDNFHVFVLLNQAGITTVARSPNRCKVRKEKETEKVRNDFMQQHMEGLKGLKLHLGARFLILFRFFLLFTYIQVQTGPN